MIDDSAPPADTAAADEPAADEPAADEPPADESAEPAAEPSEEDEIAAARFRPPGERSIGRTDPDATVETVSTVVVHHLESGTASADDAATGVEGVVSELIERVRTSDDDMVSVVSEMIEQDLDTNQMEEVLTELVERDRSARGRSG